jgi:hypothetical protein
MLKSLSRIASVAVLAAACASAHATVVFSTPSLTGDVVVTGFADGTPGTFGAAFTNLLGTVHAVALPDGDYAVSGKGVARVNGVEVFNIANYQPLYTGFLGSTGLTPGVYDFAFGAALPDAIPFAFSINYDGDASAQVMAGLAALGFPFVSPDGAGTLAISGTFGADGKSATVSFTESNLSWAGFGALLWAADGGPVVSNDSLTARFELRDISVTAVPEPGSLALVGLSLLGLAATRRRR